MAPQLVVGDWLFQHFRPVYLASDNGGYGHSKATVGMGK